MGSGQWDNPVQGYMTSPVVIDGHAYFFARSNRFTCIRLADGKRMWTSPPTGDEYWSLVAQDDRILALSNTGDLRLIKAAPTAFEVSDRVQVADDATWAHIAIAGDQIVIREQNGLAVWRWNEQAGDLTDR